MLVLVEKEIIAAEELKELLDSRRETDVILTGSSLSEEILTLADEVSRIEMMKKKA